jgi:hypothetical protein
MLVLPGRALVLLELMAFFPGRSIPAVAYCCGVSFLASVHFRQAAAALCKIPASKFSHQKDLFPDRDLLAFKIIL